MVKRKKLLTKLTHQDVKKKLKRQSKTAAKKLKKSISKARKLMAKDKR